MVRNSVKAASILTFVLMAVVPDVVADEKPYVDNAGLFLLCGDASNPDPLDGGIGGACFEPGHIGMDSEGTSSIYFSRVCLDCTGLVAAHYCQSTSGPAVATPFGGLALCEFNDVDFCDALQLVSGQNWDPSAWVYVQVLAPGSNGCTAGPTGAYAVAHSP